ncbi:MAG: S8 family serine peptidase [Verrucomicrobiota bacterium]
MSSPLPALISAEAAVKSKRSDYIALFDPAADHNHLDRCRADAAIIKETVHKLKELGFTVTDISSCTVRVEAPPALFEHAFDVTLEHALAPSVIPEVKAPVFATLKTAPGNAPAAPSPLFSLSQQPAWSDLIDSILIDNSTAQLQTMRQDDADAQAFARALDKAVVYLDEILPLLGGVGPAGPTGRGQEIAVLDDNLYWPPTPHPHFAPFTAQVQVAPHGKWRPTLASKEATAASSSSSSSGNAVPAEANRSHGTKVVANVLAVASQVNVHFFPFGKDRAGQFEAITNRIVNCSWGTFVPCPYDDSWDDVKNSGKEAKAIAELASNYLQRLEEAVKAWASRCRAKENKIIVWSAGNVGRMPPAQAYLNHLPNVLVASCALPQRDIDVDQHGQVQTTTDFASVKACEHACGGRRYQIGTKLFVMDGFGPNAARPPVDPRQRVATTVAGALSDGDPKFRHGQGGVRVPCAPEEPNAEEMPGKGYWTQSQGTSFASPQVAAVCALILEVWDEASPADVKRIIIETSVPVRQGQTCEGFPLWDQNRGVQVGLVQIDRAVKLASFMSIVVHSGRFAELTSKSTSSNTSTADIILADLRGMNPSNLPDTLAIRGNDSFAAPLLLVSRAEALARFGIVRQSGN